LCSILVGGSRQREKEKKNKKGVTVIRVFSCDPQKKKNGGERVTAKKPRRSLDGDLMPHNRDGIHQISNKKPALANYEKKKKKEKNTEIKPEKRVL